MSVCTTAEKTYLQHLLSISRGENWFSVAEKNLTFFFMYKASICIQCKNKRYILILISHGDEVGAWLEKKVLQGSLGKLVEKHYSR